MIKSRKQEEVISVLQSAIDEYQDKITGLQDNVKFSPYSIKQYREKIQALNEAIALVLAVIIK